MRLLLQNLRLSVSLTAIAFMGGCGHFDGWGHDSPHIRVLQEQSLVGLSSRPVAGQALDDFFRDKVGLILSGKSSFPLGRAVPLTRDGYYLTAWHVVDEGEFYLSNLVSLKPLPVGETVKASEYYRNDKHLGRLVWRDEVADLAIVKFDFEPLFIFRTRSTSPQIGDQVLSAAVGTNSGLLVVGEERAVGSGVGNGPYRTAGKVLNVRSFNSWVRYRSDLVARGGMSGGAVVDAGGDLVGILTQIRAIPFRPPLTTFSMLREAEIGRILTKDRVGP